MSKEALGTKRIDPETGKKFYDLGRDPIISPYTGKSYPLSYFESVRESQIIETEIDNDDEIDVVLEQPQFLSMDDSDDNSETVGIADLDNDDVSLVDSDDDSFLDDDSDDEARPVKDIMGDAFDEDEDL